jgi:hypothetical protein
MFPYIPTLIVPDQLCPLRGLREVLVPHARVQTPRLVYADLDHRVHTSLDTFLDRDGIFFVRDDEVVVFLRNKVVFLRDGIFFGHDGIFLGRDGIFLGRDGIFLGRDGIFSLGLLTILRDLGVPPMTMLALFCHLVRTISGEHTPCNTRGV